MVYSSPYVKDIATALTTFNFADFVTVTSQVQAVELIKFGVLVAVLTLIVDDIIIGTLIFGKTLFRGRSFHFTPFQILIAAPILEEFIFRLLGITAIYYFTGSIWLAIFITAVAWGLGHSYQGVHGAVIATLDGIIWGVAFLMGGYLAAVAIHFTRNFLGMISGF